MIEFRVMDARRGIPVNSNWLNTDEITVGGCGSRRYEINYLSTFLADKYWWRFLFIKIFGLYRSSHQVEYYNESSGEKIVFFFA